MTTKRVTMNKLKEILRLKYETPLSLRKIALCVNLSIGVISKYLQRAETAGLSWPLPAGLSDAELEAYLQPGRINTVSSDLAELDFTNIANELKQKGMTRQLLWGSTHRPIPTTTTATLVSRCCSSTGDKHGNCPCVSNTALERNCLWITADLHCRLSIPTPERFVALKCLLQYWAPAPTPLPRRLGHRVCQTGLDRMCEPLLSTVAYPTL
jgi:hypothetical protein